MAVEYVDLIGLLKAFKNKGLEKCSLHGKILRQVEKPSNLQDGIKLSETGIFVEMSVFAVNLKYHESFLRGNGIMNKDGKWNPNNRFGIKSKQDFFNSPEKQLQVAVASMQNNWDFLTVGNKEDGYNFDVRNYIGTEIEYKGKKYSITQSGVIAAAHLLGPYKVISFLKNPQTKEKMTDGNGTHITEYLLMAGFDLSKMLDIA